MTPEEIYHAAYNAGMKAGSETVPTPMKVHSICVATGSIDREKPSYDVDDGPCGYAKVIVSPANSKMAKWLVEQYVASKNCFGPGVYVFVAEFGQSYEKNTSFAAAFCSVLVKNGINASFTSRLD